LKNIFEKVCEIKIKYYLCSVNLKQQKMTAQEIYKKAGFATSDNRSMNWRNINKALSFGIIIEQVELGYNRTSKGGTKYRFALKFKLENGQLYCKYYIGDTLKMYHSNADIIGEFIIERIINFKNELEEKGHFKTAINIAKEKGMCKCEKCKGKGVIPHFMYYAKGVCFDCMGLGYGKQGLIKVL
jgi:hypothetical protein